MFVVSLDYRVEMSVVEQHLAAHVAYLEQEYAKGNFLASGRKVPRTGGVILANVTDRKTLEAILAQDPFNQNGVADYQIIEFEPTKTAAELDFLRVAQ